MNALMSRARSHRIDDIPNAKMTVQFGQEQSPNACLMCHGDKGMEWLDRQLKTGWNVSNALARSALECGSSSYRFPPSDHTAESQGAKEEER